MTSTTLVGEFFKATKRSTFVAGNIGIPLSDLAPRTSSSSTLVLEVSSYQLEDIHTFDPTISAILNITPDHLEHHGTMRAYVAAKARISGEPNRTRRVRAERGRCVVPALGQRLPRENIFL